MKCNILNIKRHTSQSLSWHVIQHSQITRLILLAAVHHQTTCHTADENSSGNLASQKSIWSQNSPHKAHFCMAKTWLLPFYYIMLQRSSGINHTTLTITPKRFIVIVITSSQETADYTDLSHVDVSIRFVFIQAW